MFKLLNDYSENGILLKAGEYSREELIELYGSKETFEFCLNCTSLRDVLIENKEEKMDKRIIENKAILGGFENKEVKEEVNELTLEDYKKIADEKGIKYHHKAGIKKIKELIKDSE